MAPGTGGLPLGLQIAGRRFEDDLVLRAAAAWERAQPWEAPSLAPAPARPLPAELAAALAAGESRGDDRGRRRPGRSTRRCAPASCSTLGDGGRVRAVRAWSPRAGELEVSFQVEA